MSFRTHFGHSTQRTVKDKQISCGVLEILVVLQESRFYTSTPHSCFNAVRTAASTSLTSTVGAWAGGPAASRYTPVRTSADFLNERKQNDMIISWCIKFFLCRGHMTHHPKPFAPAMSLAGLSPTIQTLGCTSSLASPSWFLTSSFAYSYVSLCGLPNVTASSLRPLVSS